MKLCKDCKYAKPQRFFFFWKVYDYAKCLHPKLMPITINRVTGEMHSYSYHCQTNRQDECGGEGIYWEAK